MRYATLLVGALSLLLAGCGYHVPGAGAPWVGKEGRTLHVQLFANRTTEPYLDSVMTEELAMQLSRLRLFELQEDPKAVDLLMDGTVTKFESRAVAYNNQDNISEYAADMMVKARLSRRSDGAVLWQEDLYRSETYAASLDKNLQQEGESLAARVIARRIAEDIVSRLLTDF